METVNDFWVTPIPNIHWVCSWVAVTLMI